MQTIHTCCATKCIATHAFERKHVDDQGTTNERACDSRQRVVRLSPHLFIDCFCFMSLVVLFVDCPVVIVCLYVCVFS